MDSPLICAYVFDGEGGAKAVTWDQVKEGVAPPESGFFWIHLRRDVAEVEEWFAEQSDLDPVIQDSFFAEESRPRCAFHGDRVVLDLRGVNLNPGADPEDMVSIRLLIEPNRIISVRRRKMMAIEDMRKAIASGRGAKDVGNFVTDLAFRMVERMDPTITDLSEQIDDFEDEYLTIPSGELRAHLGDVRRTAIQLRRYIAPQRDALNRLSVERIPWLSEKNYRHMHEAEDRVVRLVEELDAIRERAAILHDQLTDRRAENMNRSMLILSVVAAIFLPLGFLTGLLGINVGGIPGAVNPFAFWLVCLFALVIVVGEILLFRLLKWI